jgi:outer membrane lipoprotein-sorting protein
MAFKKTVGLKLVMAAAAAIIFLPVAAPSWAQSNSTQSAPPATQQKESAAPAKTALPTADQVLDHYVQATGGHDAWKKITSRVSKGTVDVPAMNLTGTIELHEKAPNEMIATVMIGGAAFVQAYDGKVAWSNDPQNGLREMSDGELDETRRDADFYRPLDLKKLYTKITVTGVEKIGEHDAYVLEASGDEGLDPEKMYFDAETGYLVRDVSQRHMADGVSPVQVDLSDYRIVDGIKLPFSMHQLAGGNEFTITMSEVRHNTELDDAQFAKPAAQ